jgi:hypothetical protein
MKTTILLSCLLLVCSSASAQPQPVNFPSLDARMENVPVFNSDSTQSTPETVIAVLLSDTVNVQRIHLQLKNPGNNQVLQQRVIQLNQQQLWEKFTGNGARQGYEIYVKLPGNFTQSRLEIELENPSGSRSPVFVR